LVESTDLPTQAHLFARAKGGSYHPIWYDPEDLVNDPPASKGAKKCPKGWQPWLTPIGDGWELVGEPVSSLSLLDHKFIRKQQSESELEQCRKGIKAKKHKNA
jgi:hypothetical protein